MSSRTKVRRRGAVAVLILGLALLLQALVGVAAPPTASGADPDPDVKVAPDVEQALDDEGKADVMVYFADKADLAAASRIDDWSDRGAAVVAALQSTARGSQADVRAVLDGAGVDHQPFWAANAISVTSAGSALVHEIASDREVTAIEAADSFRLPPTTPGVAEARVDAVEWGVAAINADAVWSTYGVRGEGIVVANIDSGVDYTHPALVDRYRGTLGSGVFDHDYNWFDPTGVCPSPAPCDNHNHGTHTMGTMAGDDGAGNQVGVAPGVRWIAAKGCATNSCSTTALLASGQWILAPTDLSGANPQSDLRPDIVNNSWRGGTGDLWYDDVVDAWIAAGIFPAFSNGNSGPGCDTAGSPGDYSQSYASGAFDIGGVIADFSSRGPGVGTELKPNVAAPGVNVRSSIAGGGYAALNGTSMASPHTAATVALMWSAAPSLIGDIAATRTLIDHTAVDVDAVSCGGTVNDNNTFGEGKLDAFAAVTQSLRLGLLDGVVANTTTGDPVVGAEVTITGPVTTTLRTGAAGDYGSSLPVGSYTVDVSKFRFVSDTASITIVEGETTTHNVALEPLPSGSISGTVTDPRGNPAVGATVTVVGTPIDPVTIDATGVYTIDSVPYGDWQVTTEADTCYSGHTRDVAVDGAETVDFNMTAASDTFGYTCAVESSGYVQGDTPVALTGDHEAQAVPMPFPFPYYGHTYSTAFLSTNGTVNFLASSNAFANAPIPSPAAPNAAIFPFFDDLLLDGGSGVFTRVSGSGHDRTFTMEFRNVTFWDATSLRLDFAVVLHENGQIAFHYRGIGPDPRERGSSASVGIENETGSTGLQMSFNRASRSDSRSLRFFSPADPTVTGTNVSVEYGRPTTMHVRVATSGQVPTGRVVLRSEGATVGAGVLVDGEVDATVYARKLEPGIHEVTINYPGDDSVNPGTGTATVTVSKATPVIIGARTVVEYGLSTIIPVRVTAPGVAPTGTVELSVDGEVIGTGTLSNRMATVDVAAQALPASSTRYDLTITYTSG